MNLWKIDYANPISNKKIVKNDPRKKSRFLKKMVFNIKKITKKSQQSKLDKITEYIKVVHKYKK